MYIDFLLQVFLENQEKDAIIWKENTYSYKWLLDSYNIAKARIEKDNIPRQAVVVIEADFSPWSVAYLLAFIESGSIVVPLTNSVSHKKDEFFEIINPWGLYTIKDSDEVKFQKINSKDSHVLYEKLRDFYHPGLILFSSGSTGKSKAALHDFVPLLNKFKIKRHALRSIPFLLYDHIGGVNTLLYTLSNAGCLVTVQSRTPEVVLSTIEKFNVELLPTSPTFLNLILLSEAYKKFNLTSLKTITYGTEPMLESTLLKLNSLFPDIQLLQTYGLSEIGILRSKSKSSGSLWMKIGGEGFETRIIDGLLEIKAESAMLGYLNAPSPFTEDGWFKTGDAVEVDKDYIKVLGRKSELINIGGEKVYPAEVESIIQQIPMVAEVTVYGEKNLITGNIVCAKVRTVESVNEKAFGSEIKKLCREKLQPFKVPVKVIFQNQSQHSERFKKVRLDVAN